MVLCGTSLCSRSIAAYLQGVSGSRGMTLEVGVDSCEDPDSPSGATADIVLVCASECSGHDNPAVYAAAQARYPDARVIAMSPRSHAWNLVTALDSGAKGFVACGIDDMEDVVSALRAVLDGDIAFSNEVSRLIVSTLKQTSMGQRDVGYTTQLGEQLTSREHGVLSLLSQGLSNHQIAHALGVSPNTVKNHLTRIYAKLGVGSRSEAIGIAIRFSLV